jgi:imidazolonepropionase-like amidohydrolase
MYREADGADELRKATREQLRQGADFIKLMSTGALTVHGEPVAPAQMTREEIGAVVEEAHRLGVRVASHAEGIDGTRQSVEVGVDTIEHGEQLHGAPDVLDRMAAAGTFLVPTLSVFHAVAEERACCFTPRLVEQAKRLREDGYRSVSAARAAGVRIAMGFDCSPHGGNALELVRLGDAGLSTRELVAAGTSVAADACGLLDVGRVVPGALADLLVVDGDPLADISVLTERSRIWLVLQGGHAVAGSTLMAGGS